MGHRYSMHFIRRAIAGNPRRGGLPTFPAFTRALPLKAVAGLFLLFAMVSGPLAGGAWAQEKQEVPNLVLEIKVEGMTTIAAGEVLSQLGTRAGLKINTNQVAEDIKRIYALGFFEDVRVEAETVAGKGYILVVVVKEKPRIVSLKIKGITRLDTKPLYEKLPLRPGNYYSRKSVDANLEQIRQAYREEGYLRVKINTQVKEVGKNQVSVLIDVTESPRYYIVDINIRGTKVFSKEQLLRKLDSVEVDCFDWMTDSGKFDWQKINEDLRRISTLYLSKGYIKVFIDKPEITLVHNPEYTKILVDMTITEGQQYFTGKLDVIGDILGDKDDLIDRMGLKPGEIYNPLQQNQDLFQMRETYQEQGYAFVRVAPDVKVDDEARTADITYRVSKGEKAYISRIEFQGNRETRDYVMRREFRVRENELYNGRNLRISQQRLMALGYFKPSLSMNFDPDEVENRLNVVTKVEEAQTGTFQFQLGYGNPAGLLASLSLSKGNFMGRGQTVRTSAEWAQHNVTRKFSVDFIEPYLFGSIISSESSLSYRTLEDSSELNRGLITEMQGSQGFGYPLWDPFKITFALAASNRSFRDSDTPTTQLRTFTTALNYNSVNHPVFPSSGANTTFSVSQIGGEVLGGSTEYRRYRIRGQKFYGLNDDNTVVFMARLQLGWLEKVGNNEIPLEDRFRLGGIGTVRGYRSREIGGAYGSRQQNLHATSQLLLDEFGQPVLDENGNPVYQYVDERTLGLDDESLSQLKGGGIQERFLNMEVLFPLAGENIRGVLFYDAGMVNSEPEQYEILGESEPGFMEVLQSVGSGVRMITPLGVFRFEYGAKIRPEEGESPNSFDFTVSTLF